jgi:putative alpha-1,2-mannosidase
LILDNPTGKNKIKFALSSVSMDGALLNLRTEVPGWNFEAVKKTGTGFLGKRIA